MILIILFILLIIYLISRYYSQENFNRNTGKWCINCEQKSFGQCMDCFNCGFCMTEKNKGYCTKGTVFGPNNIDDKCIRWMHNDEYANNLNKTNTCRE